MKRWMVWALLSFLWSIDGLFLLFDHRVSQGAFVLLIGIFFAFIGTIVSRSDTSRARKGGDAKP